MIPIVEVPQTIAEQMKNYRDIIIGIFSVEKKDLIM
jgi:hypothetical protein